MKVVIIIEGDSNSATVRYEIPRHVSSYTDTQVISKQVPILLADVMMEAANKYFKDLNKDQKPKKQ